MSATSYPASTRRLLREITSLSSLPPLEGIERLGPPSDASLLNWEAVVNGSKLGAGYDRGRWLLRITIPSEYPLKPPAVKFVTPIVHPNVALDSGEVCLDLLGKENGEGGSAWSPAYTVLECVRAVRNLLVCPEVDSPLNLDVAVLLRDGDEMGARRLVEFWCEEERYDGR